MVRGGKGSSMTSRRGGRHASSSQPSQAAGAQPGSSTHTPQIVFTQTPQAADAQPDSSQTPHTPHTPHTPQTVTRASELGSAASPQPGTYILDKLII